MRRMKQKILIFSFSLTNLYYAFEGKNDDTIGVMN